MRAPTMYNIAIQADGKWGARAGHPSFRGMGGEEEPIEVTGQASPQEALRVVMMEVRELMLKEAEGLETVR